MIYKSIQSFLLFNVKVAWVNPVCHVPHITLSSVHSIGYYSVESDIPDVKIFLGHILNLKH